MSKYLLREIAKIKDDLTVKFLKGPEFQLTDADKEAVRQARDMIQVVYAYKACHNACCALYESGEYKCGTHIYCRRMHEFSVCAEHTVLERVNWTTRMKDPDRIITLATFHGSHDATGKHVDEPYLVSPCEKCLRLLRQLSPDTLVVTDINGQGRLVKIPLDAVDFFHHPIKHNGE